MATLGNTVAGASVRQINSTARGSVFTATQDGTLVSLSAYIEDAATGDTFVGVLYNANTLTSATLVATTATRTNISTAGWYTFTFASGSITNGTAYWIGVGSNSAAGANVYHDTGTGYSIGSFNPASPPGTTDLGATVDARQISTYITYNLPGSTITPGVGSLGFTGVTPTVSVSGSASITPAAGSLALTGATVTQTLTVQAPGAGSLTFTGAAPTVARTTGATIQPAAGALALTGITSTVTNTTSGTVISPASGALAFTGRTPTAALSNMDIRPSAAILAFTGAAPNVSVTGGSNGTGERNRRRRGMLTAMWGR